ncbi:sucrase ferredoxin [Anabaena sp. UHCC 0204]|uniref:sucrase ferredoxin n=1 Tax=Anabaena sp. UHCC 0204 TaxID=2590009 RepID=UPI0014460F27|nr:sucrase ferredoxin [Anabaena sp. UHCC 0204]MTJ09684.1 sucrase ferredoxin [Anabaena sp. UHCC 0204]
MNNIFCTEESCQAKEDPIGTALNRQYYVLIEVPPPWASNPLDSKDIASKLQALKPAIDEVASSLRLLFIYNANYYETGKTRLIIYYQTAEISSKYSKQEYILSDIDDAVPIIEKCINNETLESENTNIQTRDFLVCTHGSHDKCCAKYGNPFYRQALATIEDLSLSHVRVWQSSHFGGHRFAPTMIDLPEGRYYARLNQKIFTSILTRTGDIQCLKNVYRGWGILPWQVQILERKLMLKYGWDWFNYQVQDHVIYQNEDETFNQVEITFTTPDSKVNTYRCNVIDDPTKSISFRGECGTNELVTFSQYTITEFVDMAASLISI